MRVHAGRGRVALGLRLRKRRQIGAARRQQRSRRVQLLAGEEGLGHRGGRIGVNLLGKGLRAHRAQQNHHQGNQLFHCCISFPAAMRPL